LHCFVLIFTNNMIKVYILARKQQQQQKPHTQ